MTAVRSENRWDEIPRIHFYGERGIVNSIVRRVEGEQPYPNGVVRLLKAIKWATEANQNWIEKISDARIIVELGLG